MRVLQDAGAGNGEAVDNPQFRNPSPDAVQTVYVYGTFGGATVTLEVSPIGNGDRWFDTGLSFTEAGLKNIDVRAARFRGVVTGGSGQAVSMDIL